MIKIDQKFTLTRIVSWQVAKRLSRDKRTLGLILLGPLFYVFIFGYGFAGEIKHVPVVVINLDEQASRTVFIRTIELDIGSQVSESLLVDDRVAVTTLITKENSTKLSLEQAKRLVLDKKVVAVLYIPENFSIDTIDSFFSDTVTPRNITIFLDNSNPRIGSIVMQAFSEAFQEALGEFRSAFQLEVEYGYGEGLTQLDYFAPMVIALGVFVFSFLLSLVNIIEEKRSGTLNLLLQSPCHKVQIILGYMIPFSVVSMLQTTVIIVVSMLLFDVDFGPQLPSLFLAAIILALTALGMGLFLSTFAKTELQAIQFFPLILFPSILLTGIIIPLEAIPDYFRWLSELIPLTHGIRIIQSIVIERRAIDPFSASFLYLIGFMVLSIVASTISLKES